MNLLTRNEKGLTSLNAILLAVIILFLVIVAYMFLGFRDAARVISTRGNLTNLRNAIHTYFTDYEGRYPDDLSGEGFKRYMDGIPFVLIKEAYGNGVTYGTGKPDSESTGWFYDKSNGKIYINSTLKDKIGIPYCDY